MEENTQDLTPSREGQSLNQIENDFALELDYFDPDQQEDKLWRARTGLNEKTLSGAVETIIFMSDRPVALTKIRQLIDDEIPLRVLYEALKSLQERYEDEQHGIRLVEVAEGYQFRTKATFSRFIQDLFKVHSLVLSPSTLEVLAIIAYKQPISRIEVDKIRGVDSSHIVRTLMDKRLVRIVGRSEELGRPVLYGTTPEFLEVFNLKNIDELPPEHELEEMSVNEIGKIEDIKELVNETDREKFQFDELEELDELAASLKEISIDTEFTKTLKKEDQKRLSGGGEVVRSAFDLLEEHLARQQITQVNRDSIESEMVTPFVEPRVLHNLEEAPFANRPQEEGEESAFEMLDLDTGLPVGVSDEKSETVKEAVDELKQEREALSEALDEAFARLTDDETEEETEDSLEETMDQLDQINEVAMSKAKDLDLDLDFLGEQKQSEQD